MTSHKFLRNIGFKIKDMYEYVARRHFVDSFTKSEKQALATAYHQRADDSLSKSKNIIYFQEINIQGLAIHGLALVTQMRS